MAKTVKVRVASGDPVKGKDSDMVLSKRGQIDMDLDVRDRLAELVGKGNTLTPDDKAAIFGNLVTTVGRDKATKLMNHAYIFNQRGDVQGLPLEDKLRSFYAIGSSDPDIGQIISKSKKLGYGVLPGFRESISDINQQLLGRTGAPTSVAVDPEIKKRIMVRVSK